MIFALLIIVQLAILFGTICFLEEYSGRIYGFLTFFGICVTLWLVSKDDNPSYKLAWVVLILILPVFGVLFYLIFGNKSMPQKMHKRISQSMEYEKSLLSNDFTHNDELSKIDAQLASLSRYISNTTYYPMWKNTQAEYFSVGETMWQRMIEELEKAEKFIFMEFFILEEGKMWEPIFEILKQKAAEGLDVRFLYDDLGCIQTLPSNYYKKMMDFGIKAAVFNPFEPHLNSSMNFRDHRKIVVIDGNVGFCGGINIADEYINAYEKHGHWKDTGVFLRGSAVWNLTSMFLSLWNFTCPTEDEGDYLRFHPTLWTESDGFVQPFGDSPLNGINVLECAYMQILSRATKYVYITTPYLIIDNEMATCLSIAARSGTDVRIITPHVPDKWYVHETTQSFYQSLLDAGVCIYEYTPGFIHSKMFVSDDDVAIVGTANMDYRSFFLHFECGVCFYNAKAVADVRDDILKTLEHCRQVPKNYNKTVPIYKKILRSFLRLFSPMM
ncbi:cardiolipin synthase [Oscillospiraceae bacterium NSJ-64]|uniref:Cardiolipin synthase n=2 Tax=Youxingia wuxianensis TaxID=2763678 RepID=A0A926IGS0_9FIRM|nr:cardiolipin synthase [Youxingia wuxianensis]